MFKASLNRLAVQLKRSSSARKLMVLINIAFSLGSIVPAFGGDSLFQIYYLQLPFILCGAFLVRFSLAVLGHQKTPAWTKPIPTTLQERLSDASIDDLICQVERYRNCYQFWGCVIVFIVFCFYIAHRGSHLASNFTLDSFETGALEASVLPAASFYLTLPSLLRLWQWRPSEGELAKSSIVGVSIT